jgi:hypothetical protein
MRVGTLLVATGVLHNLVGFAMGAPWLVEIAADGFVGAIEPEPMRMTLFWFVWFGWMLIFAGGLLGELERRGGIPAVFGWGLLGVAVGGGLAIPASGFWLAVPQALLILWRARDTGAA